MKREWQVGDIALIEVGCSANRHRAMYGHGWRYGAERWVADDPAIVTARPLAVIDPEDREQVERLVREMRLPVEVAAPADRLQAALREFADPKPPRPEEPTGLGAVVEDAEGSQWVRLNAVHWHSNAHPNNRHTWAEIDAVRVLSEGVTS